ncbi:unnamed protein product [Rangifer tarandus platyrhynchus]|uniref:Uncharacterized protein n=1 Tax=Rangifer tarandus platyrhynchus TaxID=3082113 RepID=A0AC59YA30_RANTA
MSWLCLSAALLVFLVSLVDSTPGLRNNIQDQDEKMIFRRQHEKHIVQEFLTLILKQADKEASKPAFCMEPQLKGDCKATITRYFYNAETGLCEQFRYSGCGGNRNNFLTKEECVKTCSPVLMKLGESVEGLGGGDQWWADSQPAFCLEPKLAGSCKNKTARYFYSAKTGCCKPFVYSGCEGNKNNFNTIEDCLKSCFSPTSMPAFCMEPKFVGVCKATMVRYFFNTQTGYCELFLYGGCGGNRNNFLTLEDCRQTCHPNAYWRVNRSVSTLLSINAILKGQNHEHTLTLCSPAHLPGDPSGRHSGG